MFSFRCTCEINKQGIKSTKKQQTFCKTYYKLSVYIKLRQTLQNLPTLKIGELLLTVNFPKFGFRYNLYS